MRLFQINDDEEFVEYEEQDFKGEHREQTLEKWLESNPDAIVEDGQLLIIGRQVTTNLGTSIDLLAVDREGNLAVIELKRDRTPRETLAQALEYAAFAASLDSKQLDTLYQTYTDDEDISLSEAHRGFFELDEDEAVSFNKDQRIVIIGQDVTSQIRQTSNFLRQKGLRVTCLEFKYFQGQTNEQLLSIDIVVGKEPMRAKSIKTSKQSSVTKEEFLAACDHIKRPVYEAILALEDNLTYFTNWVTGFSLYVNIRSKQVTLCFGRHPMSPKAGQMSTGFKSVLQYVEDGAKLVDSFRERFSNAGFVSFGKTGEMKHQLDRELTEEQIRVITKILVDLAKSAKENGLRQPD